jgi:hypothetical protein
MSREDVVRVYEMCSIDPEEVEEQSHKTLGELAAAATQRDVVFSSSPVNGVLTPVYRSLKARTSITVPSLRLRLCEIMRVYKKDNYTHAAFRMYATSETCLLGEEARTGAVRGLREELGLDVPHDDLVLKPEYGQSPLEAWKVRTSSVYHRTMSETIGSEYELTLAEIPQHEPFGKTLVHIVDGSVTCICRWFPEEEAQRRHMEAMHDSV